MTDLKTLNDEALHTATVRQAKHEQTATLTLLEYLAEIRARRLYGFLGFSSLWEYVRSLGYSESGASERIRAMELLVGSGEVVADKLKSNELTLTTASQIQSYVRKMATHSQSVSRTEKLELIEAASGKSKRDVEILLLERTPADLRPYVMPEKTRQLTPELREVRMVIDEELELLIARYKELKGQAPLAEMLKALLGDYLKRADPLRKTEPKPTSGNSHPTQSGKSRHVPEALRRLATQRAKGQCEEIGPDGKRCTSRYRLEIDHIAPFALTQDHSLKNLRMLCPTHNKTNAIAVFGLDKMARFLDPPK